MRKTLRHLRYVVLVALVAAVLVPAPAAGGDGGVVIATDKMQILGYHFPWPGLGHIGRQGDAYRYFPAPLQTVP